MSVYLIVQMQWQDPSWIESYLQVVPALITKHGGRYLVQTTEVERLEGTHETPNAAVVLEFPTRDAALAFLDDPEYEEPRASRLQHTHSEAILVPTLAG